MSGEFKKRIKSATPDESYIAYGNYAEGKTDVLEEVKEWVDEATKEFPLEVVKVKGEAGFHYLEEREAMKKLGELVLWFEKWFGE